MSEFKATIPPKTTEAQNQDIHDLCLVGHYDQMVQFLSLENKDRRTIVADAINFNSGNSFGDMKGLLEQDYHILRSSVQERHVSPIPGESLFIYAPNSVAAHVKYLALDLLLRDRIIDVDAFVSSHVFYGFDENMVENALHRFQSVLQQEF